MPGDGAGPPDDAMAQQDAGAFNRVKAARWAQKPAIDCNELSKLSAGISANGAHL